MKLLPPLFHDQNDTLNSIQLIQPKIIENIPTGGSTYGLYDYIQFCDDLLIKSLDTFSQLPLVPGSTTAMGMGAALITVTLATRIVFLPFTIYSNYAQRRLRLIQPDLQKLS